MGHGCLGLDAHGAGQVAAHDEAGPAGGAADGHGMRPADISSTRDSP